MSQIPSKLLCFFLAVFIGVSFPAWGQGTGLKPVTLQLKWLHQFQFAGYYMAKDLGLYEQAGFDVTFKEAKPGQEPIEEVLAGRAQFGVGTTDLLLLRAQGHPVVVLANIFQHSPLALMVKRSDDLLNIHQVATRKMMIEAHSAELFAYFTKEGVDLSKLDLTKHSFQVEDLISGKVDAMSVYVTDEPYIMRQAQIDYHLLRPLSSGIDFYGDNLFTLQSTIDEDPAAVARFIEASKQGWRYAMAHRAEVIQLIRDTYQSVKSPDHLMFEAEAMNDLVLSHVVETGYMNPLRWQQIVRTYQELGYLPDSFTLDGFMYEPDEDLLPDWVMKGLLFLLVFAMIASVVSIYVLQVNRRLKASEDALIEANAQKEVLMSVIGHDMKSYIFSIRRYGEMLSSQADALKNDLIGKHARQVLRLIDGAFNLMDNLLQWSVHSHKSEKLREETLDLSPLIEKNISLFRYRTLEKHIILTTSVAPDVQISANSWVLDTVLRNLLDNAIKHTPEGGSIRICLDADGVLSVEDSGPGFMSSQPMEIKDLESMQAKDSLTALQGGAGLALCKSLLKRFEATILITNREETSGACVRVVLKTV